MVHLLSVKLKRSSALSMEVSHSVRYVAVTDLGEEPKPPYPPPPPILGKKEEITGGRKTDRASKTKTTTV